MSIYADCGLCGRQLIVDSYQERCYWCGNDPYTKKPAAAANEQGGERVTTGVPISQLPQETIDRLGLNDAQAEDKFGPVPPKPKKNRQIYRWLEDNADRIVAEVKEVGTKTVRERWQMSNNTWTRFKKRHGLALGNGRPSRVKPVPASGTPPAPRPKPRSRTASAGADGHSPLPAWKDDWPEGTQVAWINAVKELALAGKAAA